MLLLIYYNKYYYRKLIQIKCTANTTTKESTNTSYTPTQEYPILTEKSSMSEPIRLGSHAGQIKELQMQMKVKQCLCRDRKGEDPE